MDPMMELVNALNALTAVLQKFTQQTTENYLNTFEALYEPPPTATFAQLRSRLSEISRNGKTVEVKKLIAKYGAEKLSDLHESDYAKVLSEAEGLK